MGKGAKRFVKFLKWTALITVSLIIGVILFRGTLYRQFFRYQSIGGRRTYAATDQELTGFIDSETASFAPDDIRDIIDLSLRLTSERLRFRDKNTSNNPNKLISTCNAHCVGYSAFFTTTCNYLLKKYHYSDRWTSKQLIGQIYFCDINIHSCIKSPFFKDHDFNVVENQQTGEQYFVDPTVHDYFRINTITGQE